MPATATDLQAFLDGPHAAVRDRVREWLSQEGNAPAHDLPLEEHRAQVLAWAKELAGRGETVAGYPREYGGDDDLGGYISGFETLGFGDLSLLVKVGVQFGLFGGAVLHLGTERHHERYLADIASLELPGCFAMTEDGHGSDVQHLRTTATYDPETARVRRRHARRRRAQDVDRQRRARRPHGGGVRAADRGRRGARRARAAGADPRRAAARCSTASGSRTAGPSWASTASTTASSGSTACACRARRCWTATPRSPRTGTYYSDIESPTKRFFSMLGTLIQGRVSVCGAAINASKVALAIAVRHAGARRQFGPPDGEEVTLMTYRTHQRRLLPHLADAYALHFAQERLVATLAERFGEEGERGRELETMAAGLKALGTWHATATVQACREACGGQGYLRANRFAALKADTDVFTTFEGDNTVLLQLVAKNLLTGFKHETEELDTLGTAAFFAGQVFALIAERSALRELDRADRRRPAPRPRRRGRPARARGAARRGALARGARAGQPRPAAARRPRRRHGPVRAADRLPGPPRAGGARVLGAARARGVRRRRRARARGRARAARHGSATCTRWRLLERERGWFQEHGRFSSTRSKAIIRAVNAACADIAPHARRLVDAFGIPEPCLASAATIAGGA